MENLVIKKNPNIYFAPEVFFDAKTGDCQIIGESYMEEPVAFYQVLISWLKDYMKLGNPVSFSFKLTYFNTSSSRFLVEIMYLLKRYESDGKQVNISWYYTSENKAMLQEEVDDFEDETGIKINFLPLPVSN